MARFKFRLETLHKMRVARRDQCRVALAEAYRAEEIVQGRRAELLRERETIIEMQRKAATEPFLDVNRLLEAQRYELVLKVQDQDFLKQEILLAAEIERRREALIESDREVRVLELLEEKQRSAYRRQNERRETKRLDEVASIIQIRNP